MKAPQANANAFKMVSRKGPDGFGFVRVQQAVCRCGTVGEYHDSSRTAKPPEVVAQHFRRHGWSIAGRRAGDRCPACLAATPSAHPGEGRDPDHKEPPMQGSASLVAEAPPAPTAEARRRIRDYLGVDYLEDQGCYAGTGSDATVAEKLAVPRAWVAEVREVGGYGPDRSEAADRRDKALESYRQELNDLAEQGLALAQKAEELSGRVTRTLEGRA